MVAREGLEGMALANCGHIWRRAQRARLGNAEATLRHAIVGAYLQGAVDALEHNGLLAHQRAAEQPAREGFVPSTRSTGQATQTVKGGE